MYHPRAQQFPFLSLEAPQQYTSIDSLSQFALSPRLPFSSNFDGVASLFDSQQRSLKNDDHHDLQMITSEDQVLMQQVHGIATLETDQFESYFHQSQNALNMNWKPAQIAESDSVHVPDKLNFISNVSGPSTTKATIADTFKDRKIDQLELYQTNDRTNYQRRYKKKLIKNQVFNWQILLEIEFNSQIKAFNKNFTPSKVILQSICRSFKASLTGFKYSFTNKLHRSVLNLVGDEAYNILVSGLRSATCVYKASHSEDQRLSSIQNATNFQKANYKINKKIFFINLLDDTYREAFMLALPYIARITYRSDHNRKRKNENEVTQAMYSKKVKEILEIVRLVDRRIKEHRQ
ncbi:hypothetical protein FGO68_gene15696 [Halteria grandinella]|uniref:Uncharacterized protein n=1 Tax=Halteria grandinella TaxID=5974 RepID=A0A8J8T0B9_HALGN|nr:hypothetical protein FGO68_gene15696 [Halteria grandinella]